MKLHFASDNWAGAHPAIAEALSNEASGFAAAYGTSDIDKRVEAAFNDLFEREVAVFFVPTGTAANALALAAVNRPGGVIFCHREAHIIIDECNAPMFFTNGAKLQGVDGALGKMDPANLEDAIAEVRNGGLNAGQAMAVSLTQATESGTIYTLDEIARIADIAHANDLPLHMDGARFANALVALGTSAAEMTWKRGVDIVSFGATKNGCWCAEALVFMDPDSARDLPFLRKRGGHLISKSRFVACQFEAYLKDGLWEKNARHANAMAADLAALIRGRNGIRLAWEPGANEVFAIVSNARADALRDGGVTFAPWQPPHAEKPLVAENEMMIRLVASFATSPKHVAGLGKLLA